MADSWTGMQEDAAATRTPLAPSETARVLVASYERLLGRRPTRPLAELLLAHIWLENRRGSAIFEHDWGNITAGASWTGPIWRPPWYDPPPDAPARILRLHELMLQGKAPSAFRSYPSHDVGSTAYLRLVHGARYRPLITAAASGDVAAFARAVHDTGYCPDCKPGPTAHTLAQLRDDIRESGALGELGAGATDDDLAFAIALAALRYAADNW